MMCQRQRRYDLGINKAIKRRHAAANLLRRGVHVAGFQFATKREKEMEMGGLLKEMEMNLGKRNRSITYAIGTVRAL